MLRMLHNPGDAMAFVRLVSRYLLWDLSHDM